MSKIICDVCGTRYPESSEQCPICGCVNKSAASEPVEEVQPAEEFEIPARPRVRGGRFSKANVRKRNKKMSVYAESEVRTRAAEKAAKEEDYDSEEEYEEGEGKGGMLLNVLLVIVIIALLGVSAYIFVQYFMPNFMGNESEITPTDSYVQQTEEPTDEPTQEPTEEPTVPCQQLVLDVTDITLREAGEMYLLNVQVLPEDTTDGIMYISSNEEVATVNEEGRVTAIGEGSVVITVVCGDQQLECNVVCDFSAEEETEEPTEEPTEPGVTKTVTSKTLNIRTDAGTKYDKVGTYKKGDVVTIYEEKKAGGQLWGRTDKGWICMEYVE